MNKFYEIKGLDNSNEPVQILLYGEIGFQNIEKGKIHSNEFIEEFQSIPKDRKILIRMNSIGGSFLDGLAIGKAIQERGNVECHVDGCCASAATIPAFCCERVTASDGAFFLLHNSRGDAEGKTAENLRNLAKQLEDKDRVMAEVYARKTGRSMDEIFEIMRKAERLSAQEALQLGLVDEIIPVTAQSKTKISAKLIMDNTKKEDTAQEQKENPTAEIQAKLDAEIAKKAEVEAKLNEETAQKAKIEAQLKAARDEMAKIKAEKINALVCDAIDDRKIKNTDKEGWINACMKDESMIERLNNLPPMNYEPVDGRNTYRVEHGADSLIEITARAKQLNGIECSDYLYKNHEIIDAALKAESPAALEARAKGYKIKAGITVDPALKVPYLHTKVIRKLDYDLGNIHEMCTTSFDTDPVIGKFKKVLMPVLPLSSETVCTWNGEYNRGGTHNTGYVEVNIDSRRYVPLSYDSESLADFEANLAEEKLMRNYAKLYQDVWIDVMSLVTPTSFPNMVCNDLKVAHNAFDYTHLAKLKNHLRKKKWPNIKLFLNSDYDTSLISSNPLVLNSAATGRPSPLATGQMFTPYGFSYYESNANIPDNDINLYGFAVTGDAILFASVPLIPSEEAKKVIDFKIMPGPNSKLPFVWRKWYDPDKDEWVEVIELRYGKKIGDPEAGCPLVSA